MFISFFRAILLYFLVLITLRILGKRQVGELQPADLVFTILLSEILAIPMQDKSIPIVSTVIPVLVLIGFELIFSCISMKNSKIRKLLQGNSILIIRDGVLDQKALKCLRFTLDDVLEGLRKKNIFDVSVVEYAFVETDGTLSVLTKAEYAPASSKDVHAKKELKSLPCALILDGEIQEDLFQEAQMTEEKLQKYMKEKAVKQQDILLLSIDKYGNDTLILKEKNV